MNGVEFSLENRVLCSDDNCIGTIGPDGHCKECGLLYSGSKPIPSDVAGAPETMKEVAETMKEDEDSVDKNIENSADDNVEKSSVLGGEETGNQDERVCCPDDNCIGIIDKNGKCGTCGEPG